MLSRASPSTNRRGACSSIGCWARATVPRDPYSLGRGQLPWQPVFLHEVAHNLQADLGIWNENRDAVAKRLAGMRPIRWRPRSTAAGTRRSSPTWPRCCWAEPRAAWGMLEFLAHPDSRALTYRPGGPNSPQLLPRPHAGRDASPDGLRQTKEPACSKVWTGLYNPRRGHIPARPTGEVGEGPTICGGGGRDRLPAAPQPGPAALADILLLHPGARRPRSRRGGMVAGAAASRAPATAPAPGLDQGPVGRPYLLPGAQWVEHRRADRRRRFRRQGCQRWSISRPGPTTARPACRRMRRRPPRSWSNSMAKMTRAKAGTA